MKTLDSANAKIQELKDAKIANVNATARKYPLGFTIKEIAVDCNIVVNSARRYILDLVESGVFQRTGKKEGNADIYIHSDFVTDKQAEENKEAVEKQEEAAKEEPQKVCAGREFENPRAVTSVVAGDISWVSSRSGNGLFFRYLILIVHSYKATCVNVFPEGHEAVNINDPNFIFVGEDPESGENLYADLTNVCQRRFSAFGERCMHISPEHMENVKNRMARLLKVDIHPVGDQGTVQKLMQEGQKMADAYSSLLNEYQNYKLNRQNYIEGLHQQFKGIIHEKKEADKAKDEIQAKLDASVEVIDKLTAECDELKAKLADLQEIYEQSRKAYFELEEKYNALKDQPAEDIKTEDSDHTTDLYIILAKYEAQKELLEKQLGEYLAIIDRLLPVNKEV